MKVFALVILTVATATAAPSSAEDVEDKTILTPSEAIFEDQQQDEAIPEPIDEVEDGMETKRKKKSATTTFCVEVKPNGPYQKPYELCESGNEIYAVPSVEQHFSAQATAAVSPQPVYGPPKTYAPAAPANNYVQSAPANPTYKSSAVKKYRSQEDGEANSDQQDVDEHMRSYGYGGGDYGGYGYGNHGLVKFIGADDKKMKKKGNSPGGVVITCQPNLAGYASPVHPGYGYGGGYRSAIQEPHQMRSFNDQTQQRTYGYGVHKGYGYNHHQPAPSYQSQGYASPPQGYAPPPQGYAPPPQPYTSYQAPAYPPPPPYQAHPPAPSYGNYGVHASAGAVVPGYAPTASYKPQSHKMTPSYGPPSYSPPGTYRDAHGEEMMKSNEEMMRSHEDAMRTNEHMMRANEEMMRTNGQMANEQHEEVNMGVMKPTEEEMKMNHEMRKGGEKDKEKFAMGKKM